jgi:hypothetical protein
VWVLQEQKIPVAVAVALDAANQLLLVVPVVLEL